MHNGSDFLFYAAEATPTGLDDYGLMIAARNMSALMYQHSSNGLFERVLELMDVEAVAALSCAFHQGSMDNDDTAIALEFDAFTEAFADHEIQNLAAGIFTAAFARIPPTSTYLNTIGMEACGHLSVQIDDWRTRFQIQEGVHP